MITSLLKRAYATDVELWTENGKLKYRAEQGMLSEELKQLLIDNKEMVVNRIDQNQAAKLKGWMTFEFGEMYSKRTAQNTELCIFRNDDDTFTVWRASYRSGDPKPFSEKALIEEASFQEAFYRANDYFDWVTKNKNNKRKAG